MTKKPPQSMLYGVSDREEVSIKLLFGEINMNTAQVVVEWILTMNYVEEPPEVLNLIINSPGGDLNAAYAIIDIMASSNIPVKTIGLGAVQSAGLMIFLAGAKGMRTLTPNTSIMSHQYGWGAAGKHHELIAINKEFNLTFTRMLDHYKKHTKLKDKDIRKYLLPAEDIFLSSEEALKYGICDRVALL